MEGRAAEEVELGAERWVVGGVCEGKGKLLNGRGTWAGARPRTVLVHAGLPQPQDHRRRRSTGQLAGFEKHRRIHGWHLTRDSRYRRSSTLPVCTLVAPPLPHRLSSRRSSSCSLSFNRCSLALFPTLGRRSGTTPFSAKHCALNPPSLTRSNLDSLTAPILHHAAVSRRVEQPIPVQGWRCYS